MNSSYTLHAVIPGIDDYLRLRRIAGLAPRSAEAYVSLIADGRANELYAQSGFMPTAPASIGMAQWPNR